MSRRRLRLAIPRLLILALLAGCGQGGSKPAQESAAGPLPWEKKTQPEPAAASTGGKRPPGSVAKAAGPPASATTALLRIQQLAQRGDLAGALQAGEEALEKDPKSRETRFLVAALAQEQAQAQARGKDRGDADKLFLRSAELMRAIHQDAGDKMNVLEKNLLPMALYNEACSYALAGEADKALASLREAFLECGATMFDLLDTDTDLVSLRKLPAFAELKEQVAAKRAEADKAKLAAAREEARKALAEDQAFAFDFTLPNLEGKPVSLEDFSGKVRIIDLWGTWCPPCAAEVPHFVALQKKYGDRGLQVVGINYEREDLSREDALAQIKAFSERVGINYPCVIGDDATKKKVPSFNAYPTTLFLDRKGKVRAKTIGYKPMEMIEAIVTTLLDEGEEGRTGTAGE